ncbi:ABC transporter permease [Tessaracoccus rhinocerotis]|uniref:Transport permease protein n=1 Tax=Tessaracoccus rhinocerotis TaxID=1689449 RepID=A0A553K287_9ACTN|nr:ABC transporter permease [Tessaracoccus rhinocerotis]TRY18809.1 ABC transporter permease [Tessaracoccus rhinocerotis]
MTTTARHAASRTRPHLPAALTTTGRIAAQLRADPRTIGIIIVMPLVLVSLLWYAFVDVPVPPGGRAPFDTIGPMMLAILPMMLMFIVTSVTMLRERTSGTLERLLTTPLSRWNLLASYGAVFGFLGVAQATLLGLLVLGPMGVEIAGTAWMLILIALLDALVGVAFGLLASAFARTEFQAVQFMPVFIGPQLFLCGLFVPKEHMPDVLGVVADFLPMTWAVDSVVDVAANETVSGATWGRLGLLAGIVVVFLFVASRSMPRQSR